MSSNTNNLEAILLDYALKLRAYSQSNLAEPEPLPLIDETIAAVLALLPEKKQHIESDRNIAYREGWNDHDDQTRRNLIGEQG